MEKILDAYEYLKCSETYEKDYDTISLSDCKDRMIEFAKLHVEAAIKSIIKFERPLLLEDRYHGHKSTIASYSGLTNTITLNKEQLKNAYPLENIK
jgi:hypothetical protein